MSTNPNIPTPASKQPRKPIEKGTLSVILLGILAVGVFITAMVSWLTTSPPKAQPGQAQPPTGKTAVATFGEQVNRAKEVIVKNAAEVTKVASLAAALHAQIPPCDAQMRAQLQGQYYLLRSNTPDAPDANLVCQPNDEWIALPPSVGQMQQPTQAQTMAESHSSATGTLTPTEKHKLRLEAIYRSSPIPLHFADATETPAGAQSVSQAVASASPVAPFAAPAASQGAAPAAEAPKREQLGIQLSSYNGPRYPLFQGRILEGLLANRLDGAQGGPVKVQISTPVYSQDAQHLLIPPGSILLGSASRVEAAGEQRLAVVFHRIIMPDGWSFLLEPTRALDQQGAGGLTGKVDKHLLSLISTAVMVGAIEGLADVTGVGSGSAVIEVSSGLSREGSNEAMQILRNSLNRPPGIKVYEGTRVRVWVAQDQALPAYENHVVKSTVE